MVGRPRLIPSISAREDVSVPVDALSCTSSMESSGATFSTKPHSTAVSWSPSCRISCSNASSMGPVPQIRIFREWPRSFSSFVASNTVVWPLYSSSRAKIPAVNPSFFSPYFRLSSSRSRWVAGVRGSAPFIIVTIRSFRAPSSSRFSSAAGLTARQRSA